METEQEQRRVVRGDANGYRVEVRRAGQWERQCWHASQGAAFECKRTGIHAPDRRAR